MNKNNIRTLAMTFLMLIAVSLTAPVRAQEPESNVTADPGWPRLFAQGANQVTVYQPQVDSWEGFATIRFRCAIGVQPGEGKEEKYGVAEVAADTAVDHEARTVITSNHRREVRFPNLSEAEAAKLRQVVDLVLPVQKSIILSLDRVLPYLEADGKTTQKAIEVNLEPPKIFYSRKPAILVMFMGKPQFRPVAAADPAFLFAVNTNWDVFYDTADSRYYLLHGEGWLASDDPVKGAWTPAAKLPETLRRLPADDNWADVRQHIPGKPAKEAPMVFVATEPAEMIITDGEPAFMPITGTKLLSVSNTDSSLFRHSGEDKYYVLVAGRWFSAKTLDGPWTSASTDLPDDFRNIPDDSPAAFVKTAVPGTRAAQDAVLLASIPMANTVSVSSPPVVDVVYAGEPKFVAMEGTTVQYAVNTANQVFLVSGAYYCCKDGMWFTASAPLGPWQPATSVPAAIYTIPPSNPHYNVTYVTVQQATPTTVVYNYTSGYSGEYVATNGVLMFGMGMLVGAAIVDHHDDYWYPPPCYYSYGVHAVYHPGYGGYYAGAYHAYGPYGGAGRAAAYNPRTGTYARGAYAYGPAGSEGVRQAYNPYTGGYAHQARVSTAYGSAGRFYAEQGGKSVAGGYRSGPQGAAGGFKTNQGTGAAAWDTQYGQGGVAKTRSGDVYAGRDGNVYKKGDSGQWQKHDSGNWNTVSPPPPSGTSRSSASTTASVSRQTTATTTASRSVTANSSAVHQDLQRNAQARSRGEQRTTQSAGFQRSGGGRRR